MDQYEPVINNTFEGHQKNTKISVAVKDEQRLMKECVELFLKAHPELAGMNFTRRFMFRKVIDYYLR